MTTLKRLLVGWCMLLLLGACAAPSESVPTSDARLTDNNFPKRLATVVLTPPTVDPSANTGDAGPVLRPTFTLAQPPTPFRPPTLTPTPFVGVFAGEALPTAIDPAQVAANNALTNPEDCDIEIAVAFAGAYSLNPGLQTFGCPRIEGISTALVAQRFERGYMFWRDTGQIVVLSDTGTYWRFIDTWTADQPESDPLVVPPEGLLQPVRGFGAVWRENLGVQEAIGWGQGPEFTVASFWQEFAGGTLFLGDNSLIYGLPTGASGPYAGGFAQ